VSDLEELAAIGVPAAISGKALLDRKIRLEEVTSFLPNA
jgi:phosphoribosylformimino-5-aminoimidazole carboxamide ribonucleotide (ProFAR) isomerase